MIYSPKKIIVINGNISLYLIWFSLHTFIHTFFIISFLLSDIPPIQAKLIVLPVLSLMVIPVVFYFIKKLIKVKKKKYIVCSEGIIERENKKVIKKIGWNELVDIKLIKESESLFTIIFYKGYNQVKRSKSMFSSNYNNYFGNRSEDYISFLYMDNYKEIMKECEKYRKAQ